MQNHPFIEVLQLLAKLFSEHTPEALMAFFGAVTSLLLFYLIWYLLHQLAGEMEHDNEQETEQDRITSALVETLVEELLIEAEHLRDSLKAMLQTAINRQDTTAETLNALMAQGESTPNQLVELLKPEFDRLQQEMRSTEERLISRLSEVISTRAQ